MTQHIIAVLVDTDGAETTLRAAYEASRAVDGSLITAFHVHIDPMSTILPTEEMMTEVRRNELEAAENRAEARVHAVYARVAGEIDASRFTWQHVFGREKDQVASLTSTARLIVMPMPGAHPSGYMREALHAALHDTHCPLLLVPRSYRQRPIENVVIGWNQDDTCLRVVQEAEPWLRQAHNVEVIHIGAGFLERESGIQAQLPKLASQPTIRFVGADGASEGERLLQAAVGADWLIVGGTHHAAFVEWLRGGVAHTVLHHAPLPVFTIG